jgi:spermidine/putrescine transport system substrate-binding protein
MKKRLALVLACVLVLSALVSLCACSRKETLHVYNWEDYIDPAVIEMFEEEYNVNVKYSAFTTNEDMFALLQSGATSYDVIFPSDYIIERMIADDLIAPIDYSLVPNFSNVDPQFASGLDFDPEGAYSVPYMWGTVGILYNTTMVEEPIDSWDVLWDERYADNILMLDSIRDSLGIALKRLGYSLNTRDEAEIEEAKNSLIEQKQYVLSYVVDQGKDKMVRGEAAIAVVWSGDAAYSIAQNPDLDYVIPKEGSNIWVDSMVIPANSEHKELAHAFIDFMCRADIAQMNAEYIGYSSPNAAAVELLDDEVKNDERFYPPKSVQDNCEYFHDLGDALDMYNEMWSEIKSGAAQ